MALRSFRDGFHLRGGNDTGIGMPPLAALVDILMSTIGIFIIVFALQKIVEAPTLQPAPYDAVVICDTGDAVRIHFKSGQTSTVAPTAFATFLEEAAPDGGRFLVAAGTACVQGGGDAAVRVLVEAFEAANRITRDAPDALHRYELAPLGNEGHDEAALLELWMGDASEVTR